jgi:hypothetical protein
MTYLQSKTIQIIIYVDSLIITLFSGLQSPFVIRLQVQLHESNSTKIPVRLTFREFVSSTCLDTCVHHVTGHNSVHAFVLPRAPVRVMFRLG